MTTYHVHGRLYIQSTYETFANTAYNAIVNKKEEGGAAYSDFRNFNIVTKEILEDATILITFSIRFNTIADRDIVSAAARNIESRFNLDYCSYVMVHKCHHDEGVVAGGIEDETIFKRGNCITVQ